MKKIITLITAAAMLAVSCQKEIPVTENTGDSSTTGKLTATIVRTKVSYTETASMDLQPAWEVGDKIIGFDDAGKTYTLTVASVSAETATLSGTVPDGALHLIYKSGAKASDISAKALAIDYTAQKGNKTMPAVMLADGTVADGACDFAFTNAGAIIGISAVKGVPSGTTISKITIEGENLSAATVALNGSALALTAKEKTGDAISTATLTGVTVVDANGTFSSPVFIAVPAGAKIARVSAIVPKEPETMKMPSATPQEGVDYVTIGGVKWAKWNVGASSETDYGWYFPWAGTEGYVRYINTWQSAKTTAVEFTYTPSPAHIASASEYLYVNTQQFETGHLFTYANVPYNTKGESTSGWTKYVPSSMPSYWSGIDSPDNKLSLDAVDDAARINWGGTWRLPTSAEFNTLYEACRNTAYDTVSYASVSCGQSTTFNKGIYYCTNYDGKAGILFCDGNKKIFFPSSGSGLSIDFNGSVTGGMYWSKNILSSKPSHVYTFEFNTTLCISQENDSRCLGVPVRAVLD